MNFDTLLSQLKQLKETIAKIEAAIEEDKIRNSIEYMSLLNQRLDVIAERCNHTRNVGDTSPCYDCTHPNKWWFD